MYLKKTEFAQQARKKYRSGQAENSLWAGRKNEVPSTAQDNKPMYNQNTLQTIIVMKVKAVIKERPTQSHQPF